MGSGTGAGSGTVGIEGCESCRTNINVTIGGLQDSERKDNSVVRAVKALYKQVGSTWESFRQFCITEVDWFTDLSAEVRAGMVAVFSGIIVTLVSSFGEPFRNSSKDFVLTLGQAFFKLVPAAWLAVLIASYCCTLVAVWPSPFRAAVGILMLIMLFYGCLVWGHSAAAYDVLFGHVKVNGFFVTSAIAFTCFFLPFACYVLVRFASFRGVGRAN